MFAGKEEGEDTSGHRVLDPQGKTAKVPLTCWASVLQSKSGGRRGECKTLGESGARTALGKVIQSRRRKAPTGHCRGVTSEPFTVVELLLEQRT